ncbi:MAG TPA: flavodoxin domain-containing protein [Oleiagrimonas sp.]|nr:flavodoxin domain-containing protein [Oleiagrimonas sp.]
MLRSTWFRDLFLDSPASAGGGHAVAAPVAGFAASSVLLVYATQTGAAESIAEATREQLEMAGIYAHMVDFYDLNLVMLERSSQVLFVVSTTFDGDPPDMGEAFYQSVMQHPATLPRLQYGVLALGDRAYDQFCGFGHNLDGWLRASGAKPWFDIIEVDDEDEQAIERWHGQVACLLARKGNSEPVFSPSSDHA